MWYWRSFCESVCEMSVFNYHTSVQNMVVSDSDIKNFEIESKVAFIFDMDGVIIDSEPLHERASKHVFSAFGIELNATIFEPFKGQTDRAIVTHLVDKHDIKDATVDELLQQKRDAYATFIDELHPIPGAIAFIQEVAISHRLALTTSASRRNQQLAFQKFNLHPFFEAVVTSNDISNPKPHPEPYQVTVQKLGLKPEECVVIEDSTNGVRSAAAAGCVVIGITTSFDQETLRECGAHIVIDSYDQLKAYLS